MTLGSQIGICRAVERTLWELPHLGIEYARADFTVLDIKDVTTQETRTERN